jgi:hypothetical protein
MERAMKRLTLFSGLLTLAGILLRLLFPWDILLTMAVTAGTVFYHIAIRLLIGCAFDRFLNNRTDFRKRWYQTAPWEKALYKKLRVKGWKQRLPTYDPGLFDPSLHSWADIARAMCQAELIHEINAAVSFLPLCFSIWLGAFPVFLITSVLAAGYDLLFVILQRSNRPRVLRLVAREAQRLPPRELSGGNTCIDD